MGNEKKQLKLYLNSMTMPEWTALIPILQEFRDKTGCLNEESIVMVGKHLGHTTSKVYGLATFYNQF
jgi:NADH:ubiquinone oxidoreductase subunit E